MKHCEICNTSWMWGENCPTCKKTIDLNETYRELLRKTDECEKTLDELAIKIRNI